MIDANGSGSTDIYYKTTNSHDSFHPRHTFDNIPYSLAKKIIVFVSDPQTMEYRLSELRSLLRNCEYPYKIIKVFTTHDFKV